MSRKPEIRVGISGWRYAPWKGVFYPKGLRAKDELAYAATRFDSIELNGSFYSLQRPEYYRAWRDQTPPGFVFAVKGSRYITHMLKLRGVETALANFFASGVLSLEGKLGPFLWQVPEALKCDLDRFARFFELLPRDTRAAQKLARNTMRDWHTAPRSETRRSVRCVTPWRGCAPDFLQGCIALAKRLGHRASRVSVHARESRRVSSE